MLAVVAYHDMISHPITNRQMTIIIAIEKAAMPGVSISKSIGNSMGISPYGLNLFFGVPFFFVGLKYLGIVE